MITSSNIFTHIAMLAINASEQHHKDILSEFRKDIREVACLTRAAAGGQR